MDLEILGTLGITVHAKRKSYYNNVKTVINKLEKDSKKLILTILAPLEIC